MIRLLFLAVVLMALPTVFYLAWRYLRGLIRGTAESDRMEFQTMPWRWLSIAGGICAVVGVASFITGEVTNPGQAYRPSPPPAASGPAPGN